MFGSSSMSTMTVCSELMVRPCWHPRPVRGYDALASLPSVGVSHYDVLGVDPEAAPRRDPQGLPRPGPPGAPGLPHRRRRRPPGPRPSSRCGRSTRPGRCSATTRCAGPTTRGCDDRRRRGPRRVARPAGTPSPDFVPYIDDDTDYAALLDEAGPGNGATVPRAVQLAPVGAVRRVGVRLLGRPGHRPDARSTPWPSSRLVLSGLSFLLTPALAVMRSLESDRD